MFVILNKDKFKYLHLSINEYAGCLKCPGHEEVDPTLVTNVVDGDNNNDNNDVDDTFPLNKTRAWAWLVRKQETSFKVKFTVFLTPQRCCPLLF
jgi:hypothetical protein